MKRGFIMEAQFVSRVVEEFQDGEIIEVKRLNEQGILVNIFYRYRRILRDENGKRDDSLLEEERLYYRKLGLEDAHDQVCNEEAGEIIDLWLKMKAEKAGRELLGLE